MANFGSSAPLRSLHPAVSSAADLLSLQNMRRTGARPLNQGFCDIQHDAAQAPLVEIAPLDYGAGTAALGFALTWMKASLQAAASKGLLFWCVAERSFAEHGIPHAEGLAHLGLDPSTLIIVRTKTQAEALWAAEQALTLPCARVLCTIPDSARSLGLTASRRLLLAAQGNQSHGLLLRFDPLTPSAAWSRWRIAAAPSQACPEIMSHADIHDLRARELGPPSFLIHLDRHRASPGGRSWRVEWNSHESIFHESIFHERPPNIAALDGPIPASSPHRTPDPAWRRAG